VDNETAKTVTASCTAGKSVVGGGWEVSGLGVDADNELVILNSFPVDADTWSVSATVDGPRGSRDESFAIRAYAICVTAL
jgi:hypothetical protein